MGLRLKKLFPNEDIIEEYSALHYRTDFTFKKHILVVKIDKKGHNGRNRDYESKRQKEFEDLGYHLIRINPDKKDFNDYEEFARVEEYITEATKKIMVDEISKMILEMKCKQYHEIKPKTLEYIVNKKLPLYKKWNKPSTFRKKSIIA